MDDEMSVRFKHVGVYHSNGFKPRKVHLSQYPVEKGSYILGNELSPVAVVIPHGGQQSLLNAAIESGAAMAGHVVTANIGLEKLIVNIVSNPNIRYLVLYGEESHGHGSGQALAALHANGVDEKNRVIGASGMTPYLRNIQMDAVRRFRRQIRYVINLLGEDNENLLRQIVHACIQEPQNAVELSTLYGRYYLYDRGALEDEPMIVPLTEKLKSTGLYEVLSPFSTSIIATTISSAYVLLIEAIMSAGLNVNDERGFTTRELLNVQVSISDPEHDKIPDGYRPEGWIKNDEETREYMEKYSKCYLKPQMMTVEYQDGKIKLVENRDMAYTYGSRLTNYPKVNSIGVDQVYITGMAIKHAIEKGHNSRRFVMSLLNPAQDIVLDTENAEIPCFTQFYVFNRKDESGIWRLNGTMFLRSHDAHGAFPSNSYAGVRILEELAKLSGAQVGKLTMFFGSAHLYNV